MNKKDFEDLFHNLQKSGYVKEYSFVGGLTANLTMKKIIGAITPEEEKQLEQRLISDELDENSRWGKFKKESENRYNCHKFLNDKFKKGERYYTPYECHWEISSWEDSQENSEYITLYYKSGEYSLYFNPDSGYTGSICLKKNMSTDYIVECIENWE